MRETKRLRAAIYSASCVCRNFPGRRLVYPTLGNHPGTLTIAWIQRVRTALTPEGMKINQRDMASEVEVHSSKVEDCAISGRLRDASLFYWPTSSVGLACDCCIISLRSVTRSSANHTSVTVLPNSTNISTHTLNVVLSPEYFTRIQKSWLQEPLPSIPYRSTPRHKLNITSHLQHNIHPHPLSYTLIPSVTYFFHESVVARIDLPIKQSHFRKPLNRGYYKLTTQQTNNIHPLTKTPTNTDPIRRPKATSHWPLFISCSVYY
jgi:hypothetical protein